MYRTDFWTLWEKTRVWGFERTALKHVYYQGWNRSPPQVGCMRQVLRVDALGRPRGMGWGGRWEGESGWGTHINPWLIHFNVWQKPLQYCKVISLQLMKINGKKIKSMITSQMKKIKISYYSIVCAISHTTEFVYCYTKHLYQHESVGLCYSAFMQKKQPIIQ